MKMYPVSVRVSTQVLTARRFLPTIAIVLLACLALLPWRAAAQVFDNFESYAAGSNLHGQGDWTGWAGDANAGALVSSAFSFSPTRSVNITGPSDLVRTFSGATSGQWVFRVMQYIPSTSTGTNAVILMNTYRPPYGAADLNWSVQIQNNMATGQVISDLGGGATLPMVKDQWVEFRFEINLGANSVSEFYNGQLLSTHAWQDGTGVNEIQALDLFANNAGSVYYDNVTLTGVTEGCPPATITGVQIVAPGSLSLSFQSVAGSSYSVEYKNSLSDPSWTTLIHLTAQPGGSTTVTDPSAVGLSRRFYRVVCYGTARGGPVHASVYATVFTGAGGASRQIFLPDIPIYVKNNATQVESARVPSDLNGWYPIPDQPSGVYQLRWQAPGFGAGVSPETVSIAGQTAYPQPIEIVLETNVITGLVTFSDGQPTYFDQPFFGLVVQTTVRLVDNFGATVAGPVRPNKSGEYVLANVPSGNFRLVAQAEAAQLVQPATIGNAQNIDLPLPNHRPRIKAVYASLAGRGVRSAAPGATVTVTVEASDPDGDPLHFFWKPTDAAGAFTSADSTNVTWTIPNSGGAHTMYVVARDSKGGYAFEKVSLSGDGEAVLFTGQICDDNGVPVSNATVVINGRAIQSNGAGSFALRLAGETNRYLLTITATGYELLSKVLPGGIVGGKYRLHKAQQFVVNPFAPIQVTAEKPNRLGAQLTIGPNSLVDPNGNLAAGPLNLFISTLDLDDPAGRLPGDFGAVNAGGQNVRLVSSAAVDIQIQDAAGLRYNLMPGKTAALRLPVDPPRLASAPPVIPIWFYDSSVGLWLQEGTANLNGSYYDATLAHFSVINADAEFTDAACMRLIVPSDSPLKLPFQLRVTVPGVNVHTAPVADALSVISRLPANTLITLEPLDSAGNPIPLAKQFVNSGAPTGSAPLYPPYPYANCDSEAILTFGVPGNGGFLDFAGLSTAADASAYYLQIDPTSSKLTLTAWKIANGFDPVNTSLDDADAAYLNAADLGLGRWMHMKKSGGNIAFYVSNYGVPPNHGSADIAALAKLTPNPNLGLIATVAMEYSPLPSQSDRFTKFYIFNAAGNRVDQAQLDSNPPKYLPMLCITCHAGSYSSSSPKFGSKFLPFDADSFSYSALGSSVSKAAQEPAFKLMNARILEMTPNPGVDYTSPNTGLSRAVEELIQGWYNGSLAPGSTSLPNLTQNPTFVPPGWTTPVDKSSLYSDVVKVSCRACHATRNAPLDWARWDGPGLFDGFKEFGSLIKLRVCNSPRMPNAEVPFNRFWLSTTPYEPAALSYGGLDFWLPTDPCP